ncbi:MAG: hypothetical protein QXR60_04095 [Candidatus Nanoarchaeia archaeon]
MIPKKAFFTCIFCLVLLSTPAFAEGIQPSVQYVKQYMSPFYRSSMASNTNYTYTFTLKSPDNIGTVRSAIINFDLWMTPTVTFNLWVNNRECNNPTYTISTTYADAGRAIVTFDCTNIITKEGTYTAVLRPTLANTGAVTAWVDVSYENAPIGKVEISGTEYDPEEPATVFVQLKDNQGQAISNGSCYLSIYAPLSNGSHNKILTNAPMIGMADDGLYYYDLTAPSTLGVYMLSAQCSYSFLKYYLYSEEDENAPLMGSLVGTWTGSGIDMMLFDSTYIKCSSVSSGGARRCEAYWVFNASDVYSKNISVLNFYYAGESDSIPVITMQVWNYATANWDTLPNTLTLSGTAASSTNPSGVDQFLSNAVNKNVSYYIGNASATYPYTVWMRINAAYSNSFALFSNWINIDADFTFGIVQDVKGSGEMHVTNTSSKCPSAMHVWNYSERNLTWLPQLANLTAQQVWEYGERNLTFYPKYSSSNLTAQEVWEYVSRSLTWFPYYANLTAEQVWSYEQRNLTYTPVTSTSNLTAEHVWEYAERNLTYYQMPVFPYYANLTATEVWEYAERNLTYYQPTSNLSREDIWNYPSRNLTYYPDTTNAESVWNYTARYIHGEII